jgi:hypothetical protein
MLHVFSRNSVKLVTRKPTTTLFRGGGSRSLRVRLAGILLWLWELFFDESLPKGAPKTAISRDLAKFPLFEHLARPGVKKCSPPTPSVHLGCHYQIAPTVRGNNNENTIAPTALSHWFPTAPRRTCRAAPQRSWPATAGACGRSHPHRRLGGR